MSRQERGDNVKLASSIAESGERTVEARLTITEVAQLLGVSVKTILRSEKAGKIHKAPRDWRGWRVYSEQEVQQLRDFFLTVH